MDAEELGSALRSKGLTLSVAESCTGGRLADRITDVSGSSDYFLGGVVSYSNEAKASVLGVDQGVIEAKGAVSEEVAVQMADGVRRRLSSSIGVGITGIAGPTGGSSEKPVGLVYIAVSSEKTRRCVKNLFKGTRGEIKEQSVSKAFEMLGEFLERSS